MLTLAGRANFGVEGNRGVLVVLYARIWCCCGGECLLELSDVAGVEL